MRSRLVPLLLTAWAIAWAAAPAGVPLYDGIGNPDEPYRYAAPPPGYQHTAPPTRARAELPVKFGRTQAEFVNTAESGPQLSLMVPGAAFAPGGSVNSVVVTATPLAPHDPLPQDGQIVGNVYRLAATTPDGDAVDLVGVGDQLPQLDMRAPTAEQPRPVFEHLVDGRWTTSRTSRVGYDVYETVIDDLGEWALVRRTGTSASSGGGGVDAPLLAAGIGVVALAVVVLVIRRRRTSAPG